MEPTRVTDYLPEWQCHKIVKAGKIIAIKDNADDSAMLGVAAATAEQPDVPPISVLMGDAWMVKHNPSVGGYFVVYEDGYLSYSPADAFESGYTLK